MNFDCFHSSASLALSLRNCSEPSSAQRLYCCCFIEHSLRSDFESSYCSKTSQCTKMWLCLAIHPKPTVTNSSLRFLSSTLLIAAAVSSCSWPGQPLVLIHTCWSFTRRSHWFQVKCYSDSGAFTVW